MVSAAAEISAFDPRADPSHGWNVANPATPRREAEAMTVELRAQFGRRLQAWREFKDMTRRELAGATDLSDDTIRIYEEGRAVPSEGRRRRGRRTDGTKPETRPTDPALFDGALRIALALGVTIQQLLFDDPPTEK